MAQVLSGWFVDCLLVRLWFVGWLVVGCLVVGILVVGILVC